MADGQEYDVFMPVQQDQEQKPSWMSLSDEHSHFTLSESKLSTTWETYLTDLNFQYPTFIFTDGGM